MIITLQTLVFFRESLLNALDRLLRPYYNKFSLAFGRNSEISDDEDPDEQVFAEYDDERGVVFYPPMYLQRYAAVSDCLLDERWCGKIEKIVDLGYHDMSFINYLKEVQGIKCILGVDIECIPLRCSMDVIGCDDYMPKRENPLEVTLFKGNAADPDYRLIGCDAVIAIEMIEHMLPHDLDRLIHTVFGFIKPHIAMFTTPNKDFNILFKALEKNGLRRLDHFFEWSREQFHDWCSNIVVRYPQYTVSCRGIGPGPNGTSHLGCCTQMALFVAKEYNKQQDLNLNSLALVSETPSPNSISNLISSWESIPTPNESKMIEAPKTNESYSELSYDKQSSITIGLTTPSSSYETIPYQDKTSQCDLDTENERNYLMFDYEQMCFDVVKPRKMESKNKVYDMEDVYNRLNCTTLEVKKFSKTTQNLMSKNRVDTLVHTREVVDEIRHLTKMLNFNKETNKQVENGTYTWCNINWGENAPYWNQYYKVVKEYHYPFETKSEECRILDLISDEINRLIDTQFDEDLSFDVNKLEIPIERLMKVVEHITDDVEKVKDLLEWNGYEILGEMVVHSRLVVDYASVEMQEDDSQDIDMCSDWDSTDVRSTSVSDGSTIVADYHARCLWRALDKKVRKLRSMQTADEDITSELDKVVCRLMKLALRTSQGRNTPPPTRWMQYKLLELLTLTEKAIERRRRHFILSYPIRAINYEEKTDDMIALEKIKEDDTASKICNKYEHLIKERGGTEDSCDNDPYLDFDLDDDLTLSSAEFAKDYEIVDHYPINVTGAENTLPNAKIFGVKDDPPNESKLERTQAWVEEDIEVVPYPDHDGNFDNSSMDTDHNLTTFSKYYKKRYKGKPCIELNCVICKKSHSKAFERIRKEQKSKENSRTKLVKKMSRKTSSHNSLRARSNNKYVSVDCKTYKVKPRRKHYKSLYPTASKPIPLSLIELCRKETMLGAESRESPVADTITNAAKGTVSYGMQVEVADTKESLFMEIVTDDTQEILALRRSVGTDADADSMNYEDETLIQSYSNTLIRDEELPEKHNVATENDNSQTIFLYDINEPTTSKGIRHVGMDVQCGPDFTVPVHPMLSATTSLSRMPKMFTAGIRIGNSATDTNIQSTEFGTCTYDNNNSYKTIIPRKRSLGITIRDSDTNIFKQSECPIVPVNSKLSATTSLIRLPQVIATENVNVNCPTAYNKMKNTNCGTSTQNVENLTKCDLPIDDKKNIDKNISDCGICTDKIENTKEVILPLVHTDNGSKSNILKAVECSTDTQDLLDNLNDILPKQHLKLADADKLTQKQVYNVDTKEKDKNIIVNVQFSTNIQECYDKPNAPSTKKKTSPKSLQKIRDCISNLPKRVKGSKPKETSQGKNKVLPQQPSRKVTKFPKATSKQRLVDTKLKEINSNVAKRKECTQKASNNAASSQVSKRVSRLPKFNTKSVDSSTNDSSSNSPTQMKCSTNTQKSCDKPEETLKISPVETSNAEQLSTDITIDEKQPLLQSINDTLNCSITQCFSGEETLNTSANEVKIDEATFDFCENVDSGVIQTQYTLQNSDIQVICGVNRIIGHPGRPSFKCGKPKLCHGGIQVHSYKDKQSLSEDVMYQGEWQVNRPKVITKRKCFNPLAPRKTESQLKKSVLSKEKIKIKAFYHRNATKTDVRSQRDLKPHAVEAENSKQEPKTSEIKQYLKLQNTVNVGPEVKPFRNFLKVPSTFPTSSLPSKKLKSPFIVKKSPTTSDNTVTKDDRTLRKKIKKNYLPLYLRKRILSSVNDIKKDDLNLSFDSAKSKIKKSKEKSPTRLLRSKTEEIKRDLLKFRTRPPKHQYDVFCNEVEKKKSDGQQMINSSNNASVKNRDAHRRRSSSPTSQNSSTCSSPCSIATVRAISTRSKNSSGIRRPASSFSTSTGNSGSDSTTPDRSRKGTKRSKSTKSAAENKENIPQTSKQFNITKKDSPKLIKNMFKGQKKDVYIAHVNEKSSLQLTAKTLSKHKIQKSNVNNTSKVVSINDKSSTPQSQSPSKKASVKFENSVLSTAPNVELSESSQTSNMVLVIEPQAREIDIPTDTLKSDKNNVFNLRSVTNWLNNSCKNINDHEVQSKDITSAIRELVDETLYFIDDEPSNSGRAIDSETVILSRENLNRLADLIKSPTSVRTILTSDEHCNEILASDLEVALERSFDIKGDDSVISLNDTRLTVTDLDALSFKSITSGSRLSGYLSADNEFSSSIKLPKCNMPSSKSMSVREIFERKNQPFQPAQPQVVSGTLANQAFSGFTINGDPISGDQPDPINYMDSETGSYSVNRQATSEELLISGRSSDSFESCELDEDPVVPNWLFQMISEQHSDIDELEPPVEFMVPLPPDEPLFDENGNVVEGPVGAGAGDGRGMHSDQSQDSSGRGTSVSSSETSSGPQSEAILIDPSAFMAQFELLREAVASSVVMVTGDNALENVENVTTSRQGPVETDVVSFSRGESRRNPRASAPPGVTVSDIDADVSSLDTDVIDSSDN